MGIGSAYGLCQLLGFFFTNMHGLLPFLMLGVGIDDMFVIMQVALNVLIYEESGFGSGQILAGSGFNPSGQTGSGSRIQTQVMKIFNLFYYFQLVCCLFFSTL